MKYRIGIDLGGTNIAAGLVNEQFTIVRKDSVPTRRAERSADDIVADMAALCKKLVAAEGISFDDVEAIGVASPGKVDHDAGYVEYSANLPFRHYPICAELTRLTGVKSVHAENDANAAAYGEALAGATKGAKHSLMITLGTGVGGGIIIDGRIYTGFNYVGGELGHNVIEKDGVLCGCGRKGCWEAYSSATALIRMTKEKMEECHAAGRATLMDSFAEKEGKVSGRTSFDAMRAGDEAAREVVDKYMSYLATGVGNMINIFQPEILAIGGGLSGEKENLLRPLEALVRKEQYGGPEMKPETKLCIAKLGNDAGIIGAAFLGI